MTDDEREVLDALDAMTDDPTGEFSRKVHEPSPHTSCQSALHAALARAQGKFPPIPRDRTVSTGSYRFSYSSLDKIHDCIRPALAEEELAVTQLLDGNGIHFLLRTQLLHSSGGVLESVWPLPAHGKPQEFGSFLTYYRRYALTALLGIASEEDDDGAAAAGTPATTTEKSSGLSVQHDKDRKAAHALHRTLVSSGAVTEDVFRQVLADQYGTEHINELDAAQTSELVKRLRKAERDARPSS